MAFYKCTYCRFNYHPEIIACILLIVNSLWLTRISTKFILIKTRTYLPALFYGFICSGMVFLQDLNPALFAVICIIPAIEKCLAPIKKRNYHINISKLHCLFQSGVCFIRGQHYNGCLMDCSCNPKNAKLAEWTISVIGFILPYIFLI